MSDPAETPVDNDIIHYFPKFSKALRFTSRRFLCYYLTMNMRLDKFFSSQKILSRKECDVFLKKGLISVNGVTVKKGDLKINPDKDKISLDGKVINYRKYAYMLVNKPFGVVSATEDGRDKTVIDLLPEELKKLGLFPCGRLDKDTTGLVILTNDGIAAHNALAPKRHVEKKYYFECADPFSPDDEKAITGGITLKDGYKTKPCRIERLSESSGYIYLTEGKYHEIKRLFGARGNKIVGLERVAFGEIVLGDLLPGEWRYMTDEEIALFINKKA